MKTACLNWSFQRCYSGILQSFHPHWTWTCRLCPHFSPCLLPSLCPLLPLSPSEWDRAPQWRGQAPAHGKCSFPPLLCHLHLHFHIHRRSFGKKIKFIWQIQQNINGIEWALLCWLTSISFALAFFKMSILGSDTPMGLCADVLECLSHIIFSLASPNLFPVHKESWALWCYL